MRRGFLEESPGILPPVGVDSRQVSSGEVSNATKGTGEGRIQRYPHPVPLSRLDHDGGTRSADLFLAPLF